jgi:hypothetical protein
VIFLEDRRQWHFQSRFIAYSQPDRDGRFRTTGLPPGKYLVLALDFIEPGEHTNAGFLERMRPRATRFSFAEAETKTLDLVLQPSS